MTTTVQQARIDVGALIRSMREHAGLSPTQVAHRSGLCRRTIFGAENNSIQGLTFQTLALIAEACNCRLRIEYLPLTAPNRALDNPRP